MAKVITFSRTFPSYHPKKGQPTYFVEKFWQSKYIDFVGWEGFWPLVNSGNGFDIGLHNKYNPKHHTIRAGNRFKEGDYFSPRVWSGKPYNSKQIIIAPDTRIEKIWDFEMDLNGVYSINGKYISEQAEYDLAINDGLSEADMQFWFMPNYNKPKEFKGQIICWNKDLIY